MFQSGRENFCYFVFFFFQCRCLLVAFYSECEFKHLYRSNLSRISPSFLSNHNVFHLFLLVSVGPERISVSLCFRRSYSLKKGQLERDYAQVGTGCSRRQPWMLHAQRSVTAERRACSSDVWRLQKLTSSLSLLCTTNAPAEGRPPLVV